MTSITSITKPELFADALTAWPLPEGFYYQVSQQGVYAYGPGISNLYTIGVVRTSDSVLIPGQDFYPDGTYGTTAELITAMAEIAWNVWNPHYLMDASVAQAVTDIGF